MARKRLKWPANFQQADETSYSCLCLVGTHRCKSLRIMWRYYHSHGEFMVICKSVVVLLSIIGIARRPRKRSLVRFFGNCYWSLDISCQYTSSDSTDIFDNAVKITYCCNVVTYNMILLKIHTKYFSQSVKFNYIIIWKGNRPMNEQVGCYFL